MELLLLIGAAAALGGVALAFKVFWPKAANERSHTGASLLGNPRALTTGQIARGVFWGMWLFTLSQILVAAIGLFAALAFGYLASGWL